MRRFWPFDDYQPIGLADLSFTAFCVSMVIWPPFFGVMQCLGCIQRFTHSPSSRFATLLIAILIATGAAIGILCTLAAVLGGYYHLSWLRRYGPFLIAVILVGPESWGLPFLFTQEPIHWRHPLIRIVSGILVALPGAWVTVQVAYKASKVHPYRNQMDLSSLESRSENGGEGNNSL